MTVAVTTTSLSWSCTPKTDGVKPLTPTNLSVERSMQSDEASYELPDAVQADMLRKLALYWDGQWFLTTAEEFGLEAAIRMNARVRASFGRIEMRTLLKALGKKRAVDLPDAVRMLETYLQVFMGNRLRAQLSVVSDGEATVTVSRCPAFEGARKANLERIDQACVACEGLWPAWLSVLLPDRATEVQFVLRQGKGNPHCHFTIRAAPPS